MENLRWRTCCRQSAALVGRLRVPCGRKLTTPCGVQLTSRCTFLRSRRSNVPVFHSVAEVEKKLMQVASPSGVWEPDDGRFEGLKFEHLYMRRKSAALFIHLISQSSTVRWCGHGSRPILPYLGRIGIHFPAVLMFTRGSYGFGP